MNLIGSINLSNAATWMRAPEAPRLTPDAAAQLVGTSSSPASLAAGATASTSLGTTVQPASFSNILERAVHEVDAKMHTAETEKTKLLTGETNNVHQSMIAVQESSVAFSLMVEVRNKLVDSYQELMRMQV